MAATGRSGCPINLAVELFGDRWTLLILRDIAFAHRRHFRDILRGSDEGLTSSVLADRLHRLIDAGVLTRADDPTHKQKAVYSLTDSGIDLVPVLATIGTWGAAHCPADPDKAVIARELDYEVPAPWAARMKSLRAENAT